MEFNDKGAKIWRSICNSKVMSESQYERYIEQLDLGIRYIEQDARAWEYALDMSYIFVKYKIVDEKKWCLSKLRYGI